MRDLNPHESLEDLRVTLEQSKEHISNSWIKSEWFEYDDDGVSVIGMCAAGSVLYSMGYTGLQWARKESVQAVLKALVEVMEPGQRVGRFESLEVYLSYWKDYYAKRQLLTPGFVGTSAEVLTTRYYTDTVTNFNDNNFTTKEDVLDLFDKAIKATIQKMEDL